MRYAIYIALFVCALAMPRCADAQDGRARPGVIDSFDIMQGDVLRRYDVYLPENAPPDKPRSLVFVLHGGWKADVGEGEIKSGKPPGKAMSKLTGGGWEKVAERENVVIVYPVAVNARWNDGRDDTKRITHDMDDVGFIAMLIDRMVAEYGVDPKRVYASGLSNGAKMSFRLACELGDKIAAIAPVDGNLVPQTAQNCAPRRVAPMVLFHGTSYPRAMTRLYDKMDQNPHEMYAETIAFWTKLSRCGGETRTTVLPDARMDGTSVKIIDYVGCEKAAIRVYRIEGGGHTWPGGSQYFPRFLIGNASREIDAAAQAWTFLGRHILPD